MSKHQICKLCLCLVMALCELPLMAQGVIVYKKDGSKVKYPYETIDSIVTYNYDDVIDDEVKDEVGENRTFTVNGVSFTMIKVVGGTFKMGATSEQEGAEDDELPVHNVTLNDYYIGDTEVTQELWTAVMGTNPSHHLGDILRPVDYVSWDDCQTFISKLNVLTGESFHLPTEAQWEYAARGGDQSKGYLYSGGNTINDVAWYHGNYDKDYGTRPVKTKQPNELGLYDMSGNVREWCQDWYGNYSSTAVANPKGPNTGSKRVNRGGNSWMTEDYLRVARRAANEPEFKYFLGLRLAL